MGRSCEALMVALLCMVVGLLTFEMTGTNYLMPFIKPDLALTNGQIGILASGFAVTFAAAGVLAGGLLGRAGKRKATLVVMTLLFSGFSMLSAFATSFTSLLVARLVMGLIEGPIIPLVQTIIAVDSHPARRGVNMGIVQTLGSGVFAMFAPVLLVAIATKFGWHAGYLVVVVPALICALLAAMTMRDPATNRHPRDGAVQAHRATATHVRAVLSVRNVWLCAVGAAFMNANLIISVVFFPLFLLRVEHLSVKQMSLLMTIAGLSSIVFGTIFPMISDRIGRKPAMVLASLFGGLGSLAAIAGPGAVGLMVVFMFFGWALAGGSSLFSAIVPSESVPSNLIPSAIGLVNAVAMLLGGVVAPAIAGWSADRWGLVAPVSIQSGCALAAGIIAAFVVETASGKVRRIEEAACS